MQGGKFTYSYIQDYISCYAAEFQVRQFNVLFHYITATASKVLAYFLYRHVIEVSEYLFIN